MSLAPGLDQPWEGGGLDRQTGCDYQKVSDQPEGEAAEVPANVRTVGAQQEAILDRVAVDPRLTAAAAFRAKSTLVKGPGRWDVEAAPFPVLETPGQLRVFPVVEK